MTRPLSNRYFPAACLTVLLASVQVCAAQQQGTRGPPAAAGIPESKIASLQAELAQHSKATSSVKKRRACKSTIRKGAALVDASPAAPNRFRVLAIVLQSQKRLLMLDKSDRNRDALYDTCSKLAKAPDTYAELRLEADLILSEKALTLKNADVKERAKALAALIKRYRDTPGEAKSLMLASLIAPKLDAFDLEKQIYQAMDDRFAGDLKVIAWRRSHRDFGHFRVLFTGTFTRADGTSLSFPIDGMGHTRLMYFWSKDTQDIEQRLAEIKALQTRFPGQFEVYSFNLDGLPDAGEKKLRTLGLDWTALHLPGGRKSLAYRVYVGRGSRSVRVNAHGHALLPSNVIRTRVEEMPMEQNLDDARYLSQLQSLLIGDFLVTDTDSGDKRIRTAGSVPEKVLGAIQGCFIAAPLRYRLTREQAMSNYQKAEKLCRDAITQYSKAPDLWRVRNCRIIALLGMWNMACEPKHLESAVDQARIALAATLPLEADVVPRFCLAKKLLRQGDSNPTSVLSALVKETGRTDAPASSYAAAAILAMDVNSRELHAKYRQMLLETHNGSPAMWPVVSFLRDQNHTFRLFQANYYLPPSRARRIVRANLRRNAGALDAEADASGPLKAQFNTFTGGKLNLPQATDGKLTLLMFVEPPADPSVDLPTAINGSVTEDSRGRKREISGVMQNAFKLADEHIRKDIKVIAAFLSDDADRVKALMKKHKWPCQVALVPGGLKNPLVRRLGILWADRVPNIAMLRGDGTIAWTISGVVHPQLRSEGVVELMHVINRGMKTNIASYEIEASIRALKKGDFPGAVQLFSGPFPSPKKFNPDGWTAPRLYGRAVAHMGLKKWDAALVDIDTAIEAHQWVFNRKMPCMCKHVAELRMTKASILDQLGKPREANAARQRAVAATSSHSTRRYWLFHDQIKALSMKEIK
ncbi:MAG: hypothetical protein QGH60_18990 [Phycisphaerae bacterium]|nr:hypothetical protein [Phycisphaerae bacterium]